MTDYAYRSIIVTAANAEFARYVAGQFGPSSQGMFTAALQPVGDDVEDPTHFISAGLMDPLFADMLASPTTLVEGAAAFGVVLPLAMAKKLLDTSDVSLEDGLQACARLRLRLHIPRPQVLTDADGEPIVVDGDPLMES